METRGNREECKLRVKLVRRPVWLFTCLTCPRSTLVNNSWWKFPYLSATTLQKMHLEPKGVQPVSVHSLNPLLGCLFLLSSSSPPAPSVSAFYWRPVGQGPCAADVEHWVFRPKLLPKHQNKSSGPTRKTLKNNWHLCEAERVCNLNLAISKYQQKVLNRCVLSNH